MADLTAFSSKAFNSSAWINAALKDTPEDESLEAYISSLTTKLHIMSQDYTDQLETAMVESMSTMPRILSEITKTEDQLRSIEAEMKSLSQQLNSFDQRNVAGVEDLSRLDTLKTNMERCKATLEEHARWSQLVREAKIIMEGGGRLSDSADRIETMYKSLAILKNLPGNMEREETCETFKNSLLTALRPIVRRDVAGLDITPLQEYLYVFQKLGREQELEEEYVRARPDRIKTLWTEYSPAKHPDFPKWLATFLGKVARLLSDEEASTSTLFGAEKSPVVLCDILVEALAPLTAGLGERLADLRAPEAVFDTYCVMEEFARRMLVHLQRVDETKQAQVLEAMYSAFVTFLPQYADMETQSVRAQLVRLLDTVAFSSREAEAKPQGRQGSAGASLDDELFGEEGDAADAYGLYGEKILSSAELFIQPLEHALKRAVRFAGGVQIKHIVRLLSATLALFMKHLVLKIDDLSVASGFPRDHAILLANGGLYNENADLDAASAKGTAKLQQQQAVAERFAQQLELSDVDSRVLITSALRALQSIGRLSKNFAALETLTRGLLVELQQSVLVGRAGASLLGLKHTPSAITSVGSVYSMQVLHRDANTLSELKSFLVAPSSASQVSQAPFAAVSVVLKKLRGASSQLLFGLCLEAPEKMLGTFAQEDVWGVVSAPGADRDQLRENMLPQSVVTQVGEHLLSLVQELEAFASSDALVDILKVRGQAGALANSSAGWQALKRLLGVTDDEVLSGLSSKPKCAPLIATIETTLLGHETAAQVLAERPDYTSEEYEVVLPAPVSPMGAGGIKDSASSASLSDTAVGATTAVVEEVDLDGTAVLKFVNEWLGAIADATVGLLLGQVALVPELTTSGCAQLITDLEYLSNVINATGIKPHPLLSHVRVILEQDPAALVQAIELLPGKTKGAVGFLIKLDGILVAAIAKGATHK